MLIEKGTLISVYLECRRCKLRWARHRARWRAQRVASKVAPGDALDVIDSGRIIGVELQDFRAIRQTRVGE